MFIYSNELYIKFKKANQNYKNEDKEFYLVKRKFIADLQKENNYKELR